MKLVSLSTKNRFAVIINFFFFSVVLLSCRAPKNIAYFRDIPDSTGNSFPAIPSQPFTDPLIKSNDILQVSILTLDPQQNVGLTSTNASTYATNSSAGAAPDIQGFMVDSKGEIELPIIGRTRVTGLTTTQIKDSIHAKVAVYYKNPVVNVRLVNFNITVLGEVNRPGTYVVANEKANLLDAIGMAGDLTIYGKRENVMLVRDSAGTKLFGRFNLTATDKVIKSPFYYLRQGDVIYVEPSKAKIASTDVMRTRTYALIASIITVFVVVISKL